MDFKYFTNIFSFQGFLSKKDFWNNYLEKLFILVSSNCFLASLISFDGTTGYGAAAASDIGRIYFLTDNLMEFFIIINSTSFIIFSIYLLAICRRRVRDMGADPLVSIIFSTPLSIVSAIYFIFAIRSSIDFFVYLYLGNFHFLKCCALREFVVTFLILLMIKRLKN